MSNFKEGRYYSRLHVSVNLLFGIWPPSCAPPSWPPPLLISVSLTVDAIINNKPFKMDDAISAIV